MATDLFERKETPSWDFDVSFKITFPIPRDKSVIRYQVFVSWFIICNLFHVHLLDQESDGRWKWIKPPPASKQALKALGPKERKRVRKAQSNTMRVKLVKGLSLQLSFPKRVT